MDPATAELAHAVHGLPLIKAIEVRAPGRLWYTQSKPVIGPRRTVSFRELSKHKGISPPTLRQNGSREEDRSRASARDGKISRHQWLVKAPLGIEQ